MEFKKQAKTIDEQIALLASRGMLFDDLDYAKKVLSRISYYRLRAYWHTFEIDNSVYSTHFFKPNTYFEQVVKTYEFDRQLRHIVFNAIERIEIALRTQMIYCVTNKTKEVNWYTNPKYFYNENHFDNLMQLFKQEYAKSREVFIVHYKEKYNSPPFPPAWMGLEILSFGQLSKLFRNLKNEYGKSEVSVFFGIPSKFLSSWLGALTYYRNVCAHHGRLWNKKSNSAPMYPNKPKKNKAPLFKWLEIEPPTDKRDRLYINLAIIYLMLKPLDCHMEYKERLFALLASHKSLPSHYLGFPKQWEKDSFWCLD